MIINEGLSKASRMPLAMLSYDVQVNQAVAEA